MNTNGSSSSCSSSLSSGSPRSRPAGKLEPLAASVAADRRRGRHDGVDSETQRLGKAPVDAARFANWRTRIVRPAARHTKVKMKILLFVLVSSPLVALGFEAHTSGSLKPPSFPSLVRISGTCSCVTLRSPSPNCISFPVGPKISHTTNFFGLKRPQQDRL